jgi:hypothetical protein
MKLNLTRALLLFAAAYLLVSVLATGISVAYQVIYKTPQPPPGVSVLKSEAFLATVPYHVLVMLIIWPLFARIYFKKTAAKKNDTQQTGETWQLALLWLLAAMVVDWLCFVLPSHPYAFPAHEFYVDYQPWISLIYLAIFLSPWLYRKVSQLLVK